MRVLMLGWELPPNNSGGLGVACLQLSEALSRRGADIDFVLPYRHEQKYGFMNVISVFEKDIKAVVPVAAYDSYRYIMDDGSVYDFSIHDQQSAYAHLVGRLVDEMEFDIVHAHDWLTFRAGLMAKQKRNVPLILHVHSIERDRAGGQAGNPLVREVEATAMQLADHVVAVSGRTKNMIIDEYHIPADKIDVVHNSLDTSRWVPLDDDNAYKYLSDLKSDGWKVVANVGRLTIQKGLTHFISAAAEVVSRHPKTIFLLVGDGEQRDELLELAAEKGIARNILFTGFQRGKNWRDAYAIADLFVMPSVSEPFGLTPFEAAAYGTPSLISRQSGISEVFRNCLKVDFWDEREIANKILAVINSQALKDELGSSAREEFLQLSWDKAAGAIFDRYNFFMDKVLA